MIKNNFFLLLFVALFFAIACSSEQKATNEETNVEQQMDSLYVKEAPEWSYNANIYEVNVRQFTAEGTFNAFAEHLPRLKDMGVDILWFMPIHPIGVANRKGTLGSSYSIKDYKGVNPEFGTLTDFKQIVDKAHELGMYVILDWVANHSAFDNQLATDHPEWYTRDSTGTIIHPAGTDWTDVADFNYNEEGMQEYMIGALKYWITEANIDGYRCDVANEVPTEFWVKARTELDKLKDVFMLAEADVPELHEAFDMTYGWEMHALLNQVAKKEKNANDLTQYFIDQKEKYKPNDFRLYFTSNHDENTWHGSEYERMGEGAKTFAVLCVAVPGMPLIYNGQESAFKDRLEFFEKDTLDWGDYELNDFYKQLLSLKKENEVLWNGNKGGELMPINTSDKENVFAFTRSKDNSKLVAFFNLSAKDVKFTVENALPEGEFTKIFSNEKITFSNKDFKLKAWEYIVCVQ